MSDGIDIFNEFAVSDDAIYVPYAEGVEFLIARADNPKFNSLASRFYKQHKRTLEASNAAADAKMIEMTVYLYSETILLGWKGKVTLKGEALTYSKENAKKLLAIEGFRDWVATQARDTQAYKVVQEQETQKN